MTNLDDELHRLFNDDRLAVPARSDAEQVIVAGVRRVRSRRIAVAAATGALSVVALVAGGVALAGVNRPQTMPPAGVPSLTSTLTSALPTYPPSPAQTPPSSDGSAAGSAPVSPTSKAGTPRAPVGTVLGPDGYGKLKLGMTADQALATHEVAPGADTPGPTYCAPYYLADHGEQPRVQVSPKVGVASIDAFSGMRTPEGIGLGSTMAQVKTAYPNLVIRPNSYSVVVPGNNKAIYRFGFGANGQKVAILMLQHKDYDCGN